MVLGFDSQQGLGIFLFTTMSRLALGTPPLKSVLGALSLGVKQLRSRMCGAILPLPQYVSMMWCLLNHRDNCTFTFKNIRMFD
jgi:hypothetical protein